MASSRRPVRRRSGRGSSSSSSSQQAIYIGAGAVVVLALVILFATSGSSAKSRGEGAAPAPKDATTTQRQAPPVAKPAARQGGTPDRPAPPLTDATLRELGDLYRQAVDAYNDSVRARRESDHAGVRAGVGEAKKLLDRWKALVQPNLDWQEYAQMDDWAQPPEYMELERRYQEYSTLNKKVRMGGG